MKLHTKTGGAAAALHATDSQSENNTLTHTHSRVLNTYMQMLSLSAPPPRTANSNPAAASHSGLTFCHLAQRLSKKQKQSEKKQEGRK